MEVWVYLSGRMLKKKRVYKKGCLIEMTVNL